MEDILQKIVESKRAEVERMKRETPERLLHARVERMAGGLLPSLKGALRRSPTGVIAEFKRRSPSKGWINEGAQASVVPLDYQRNGAAAVSILTDETFFGGADGFITEAARSGVTLPVLYKNFIVDEYQLFQARLCGASAVLLIASALGLGESKRLMATAHELGMEVLLELHGEGELDYAGLSPDVCGVNNRNLGTFVTDVANSFKMAPLLPEGLCRISESGISSPETAAGLRAAGYQGFLIGESFMAAERPGEALRSFISEVARRPGRPSEGRLQVKVCGLREPGNVRDVAGLGVDMEGFIFYEGSSRHVTPRQMSAVCEAGGGAADGGRRPLRVGVFVDAPLEEVVRTAKTYSLDCVQMHGGEDAARLARLRAILDGEAMGGVMIIKALSVATREDAERGADYAGTADMLLFDTKGDAPGGNGERFNWSVLEAYRGPLPFILSGGIGPECAAEITAFSHPMLAGIDLNSRFETAPGVKDIGRLRMFIDSLKQASLVNHSFKN